MNESLSGVLIAGGTFLFVGLVFAIIGLHGVLRTRKLAARCTEETTGLVARMITYSDNDGTTYKPEIEYTVAGRQYTVRPDASMSRSSLKVGYDTRVRYDPFDPRVAWLPDDRATRRSRLIMLTLGVVWMTIGIGIMIDGLLQFLGWIR
ncbi:DUF3592 domain-containing protein [Bifidobacterium sp. 82T10]|uniref:DUF3592 domain-containing protein n=1 Tax=Bifidobacterium miconis TaxID=2834435 RepID=A0ABS6WH00_9BIFI|nr:DUF3592 domain-containing protein [Bifidobacterium miconis]MBW3093330.1 DUF3592 domain-containing protein [Bifidobacterium miconis]